MSWSIADPVAVVAPHLLHPARNGADISLERVSRFLSLHSEFVDLVGCNTVRRYRAGNLLHERSFNNRLRSKSVSGFMTILNRSHYLLERFNTPAFRQNLTDVLCNVNYGTVLSSYITTTSMLHEMRAGQRLLVWTHNDELKWFSDLSRHAPSSLGRLVARISIRWLRREVPSIGTRAVFLHVTEMDRRGFQRLMPRSNNIVVPIGTDIDASPTWPDFKEKDPIILTFSGGLSMQMSLDALRHFRGTFEPTLRNSLGSRLKVRIVGSNPSASLCKLVAGTDWELFRDVTDQVLSDLLRESTFTFLPFAYSTGVKLKLIRSLGSGVPFLSTLASEFDQLGQPPLCCFSDDPLRWVKAIEDWISVPDKGAVHRDLMDIAERYSWRATVLKLTEELARQ